jgi:hypothetical protein
MASAYAPGIPVNATRSEGIDVANAFADRFHHSRAFYAHGERHLAGVSAPALADV